MDSNMQKGVLFFMVSKVIWILSAFVINVGLGRLLGPEQYGIFGIVMSVISIFYIVLGNGMRQAITKHIAENAELAGAVKNTALKIQVIYALALTALVLLLAKPVAATLGNESLTGLIRLSALTILPTSILFSYMGVFNGVKEFRLNAVISIIYALLRVLFVFGFVLLGLQVRGAVIGMILAMLLSTVIAGFWSREHSGPGSFEAARLVRFALPVTVFFIANALLMHMDIFFVKSILGDEARTGYYAAGQTLSRVVYFVFSTFSLVLLPSISDALARNDPELARTHIRQSLRYMILLILPTATIISATSREIIDLFYGQSFGPAAEPLRFLVFGISFLSITLALSAVIQGFGAPRVPLIIFSAILPVDILLLVVLIKGFGLYGGALATALSLFTGLVVSALYIYKVFGTLVNFSSVAKIIFACIAVAVLAMAVPVQGIFLPLYCLGLFGLYFILLLALGEISVEERTLFKEKLNFLRKKKMA